jgi:hypothetical protein
VLALEWNADKTCCGTLNGTFDLATGQLEAQIEYTMAGEQQGYSFMLSKMPLWENVAKPEPRIMQAVETIAGSLYGS